MITKRNLRDEFHFTYTGYGVVNNQQNNFTETGMNSAKWILVSEYRIGGLMNSLPG